MGGDESVIDFSMFGEATCLEEFILNIATFHATCTCTVAFHSPSKYKGIDIYLKYQVYKYQVSKYHRIFLSCVLEYLETSVKVVLV